MIPVWVPLQTELNIFNVQRDRNHQVPLASASDSRPNCILSKGDWKLPMDPEYHQTAGRLASVLSLSPLPLVYLHRYMSSLDLPSHTVLINNTWPGPKEVSFHDKCRESWHDAQEICKARGGRLWEPVGEGSVFRELGYSEGRREPSWIWAPPAGRRVSIWCPIFL